MDRRERRKSAQSKVKRVRSFYGKKAKVSKSDIASMQDHLKVSGRQMMSKKLIFVFVLILVLLFGLTYLGYFR